VTASQAISSAFAAASAVAQWNADLEVFESRACKTSTRIASERTKRGEVVQKGCVAGPYRTGLVVQFDALENIKRKPLRFLEINAPSLDCADHVRICEIAK